MKGLVYLVVLLPLLTLNPIGANPPQDGNPPELILRDKSFSLTTKIKVGLEEDARVYLYNVVENYSSWQRRSKVDYEIVGHSSESHILPSRGTFFVDNSNVLLYNRELKKCKSSDAQAMRKHLHLDYLEDKEGSAVEELYLAGPARILYFLDRHRDKLVRQSETERTRNIPSYYYEFEYMTSSRMLTFYVHYANLEETNPLPIRVLVHIPGDRDITFDFTLNELISEGSGHRQTTLVASSQANEEPIFDHFSVDPAIGCSRLLPASPHWPLKPQADDDNNSNRLQSFSFKASSVHIYGKYPNVQGNVFVAYESSIDSLKVHSKSVNRSSSLLTNFRLGRTYNIVHLDENWPHDLLFNRLFNYTPDPRDLQHSCIVTTAPTLADVGGCPYSLSELLAGSREFVFIGYAQVRGIWTRAYEAFNSSRPVWMEQPVEAQIRSPSANWRDFTLNTIVYMINDDDDQVGDDDDDGVDGQAKDQQPRPILIEILRLSAADLSLMSRTRVEMFDFVWSVEASSRIAGEQHATVDLFSLTDYCPASDTQNNYYGSVTMQLIGDNNNNRNPIEYDQIIGPLRASSSRNFALLAGLQNQLDLPITMIYDLRSRFESGEMNENDHLDSLKVSLSFHVAQHASQLVELVPYGRGGPKNKNVPQLITVRAATFRNCFFTAAHRKQDTFFAYWAVQEICHIDLRDDVYEPTDSHSPNGTSVMPRAFDVHEAGAMEVFLIKHRPDHSLPSRYQTLTEMGAGRELIKYVKTLKKFELPIIGSPKPQTIHMSISSFEVNQPAAETPEEDMYVVNGTVYDKNKFTGFGLVAGDPQSTLITANKISSRNWAPNLAGTESLGHSVEHDTEMSLEQCRATCLGDFECQSFSICLEDSQLRCITSRVSFREPPMTRQLIRANKSGRRLVIELTTVSGGIVQVRRHPNCELHNKQHLSLFMEPTRVEQSISSRLIYQVSGREECARLCFQLTVKLLRHDLEQLTRSSGSSSNDLDSLIKLFKEHQDTRSDLCSALFYLDEASFGALPAAVQERISRRLVKTGEQQQQQQQDENGNAKNVAGGGYCITDWRPGKLEREQLDKMTQTGGVSGPLVEESASTKYVKFECRRFDFSTMFEQQLGVSLRATPLTDAELAATYEIRRKGTEASRESFEAIGAVVGRIDNLQTRMSGTQQYCAQVCFSQSFGLWPGCKSFDIRLLQFGQHLQTECLLNSMSLRDVLHLQRLDLISTDARNDSSDPQREHILGKVWHFEPKAGFVSQRLDVIERSELNWWPEWASQLLTNRPNKIKALGTFWLVLLASALGLVLGVWLNKIRSVAALRGLAGGWSGNSSSSHQYDTRYLVEKETIEFNGGHLGDDDNRQ